MTKAMMFVLLGVAAGTLSGLIGIGFFIGGLIGARIATSLSGAALEKVFGVALLLISLRMIFSR